MQCSTFKVKLMFGAFKVNVRGLICACNKTTGFAKAIIWQPEYKTVHRHYKGTCRLSEV